VYFGPAFVAITGAVPLLLNVQESFMPFGDGSTSHPCHEYGDHSSKTAKEPAAAKSTRKAP
jgi:hypothetical protein